MAEDDEELAVLAETPEKFRNLRACLRCSLVKTFDQFVTNGCDNCPFLMMDGNKVNVQHCTTAYFEGLIGMIDPGSSWVAHWQRIDSCKPGMYAIEIMGVLPQRWQDYCEAKNIPYKAKQNRAS